MGISQPDESLDAYCNQQYYSSAPRAATQYYICADLETQ